ncbi:MAG: hypothetical protein JWN86_868 [Planctomycetota bacterium]|nr:hypothetical protein [Planctomycetota bacterium]
MRTRLRTFFDRRDDRRARALRDQLGLCGVLVSWHRIDAAHPDGTGRGWLARVSCRVWPETIERPGPNRCRAIRHAAEVLERLARETDSVG